MNFMHFDGREVAGLSSDEVINFFLNLLSPSIRTIAMGFSQSLREMSAQGILGIKARPASKAVNLTAICEPIV
jgi:hypothetical protein